MPLSLGPTFQSVVTELLVNLGRSVQGNHSNATYALAQSWVRRAHEMLYYDVEWVRLAKTVDITLTEDVREYDIPEEVDPGRIQRVLVIKAAAKEDEKEYPVGMGIRPNERNSAQESGRPLRIELIDGEFKLWPAPDDVWAGTLRLEVVEGLTELNEQGDRVVVDKTALLLQAEILGKNHYGMPGIQLLVALLGKRIDDLRAAQSDDESIQIGGPQAHVVSSIRTRNRITNGGTRQSSGDDWNPWS